MSEHVLFKQASMFRKDEQMVAFDFSQKIFQDYFLSEMGGEEYFQTKFPKLYKRYIAAVELAKNPPDIFKVGEPDAFQDAVDIFYGFYNREQKSLFCKGVTSIKNEAYNICQRIHVYDSNGELIVATGDVKSYCRHAVLELNFPCELEERGQNLIFDYFSLWYSENNGLQAAYYSTEDSLVWNETDYVEAVTVVNPIHKKTSKTSPIIVCYNRTAASGETVDYDNYEESFDPVSHIQKLYLDVGAEVTLTADASSFTCIDITKFLLKLDCQSGIAVYKKDGRVHEIMEKFAADDNGFSFNLDKDWKGVVPAARLPQREPVDFLMRVEFLTDNSTKRGRFIIDSSVDPVITAGYVQSISQLQLLWGCIEHETPVLMADGSILPANEISIGDEIRLEESVGVVTEVFRGREMCPMLCIETVNGRKICCSKAHPLLTDGGYKRAADICGNDHLKDITDGYVDILSIYPVDKHLVVNFQVKSNTPEEASCIICDNLVVGDYDEQCRCEQAAQKAEEQRRGSRTLQEETEELIKYFKGA